MQLTIQTGTSRLEVEAPVGTNLADVLTGAGLHLNLACGGHGSCLRCSVHVREGSFHITGKPVPVGGKTAWPSCRMSCGEGPAFIEVPASALGPAHGRILDDCLLPPHTFTPSTRAGIDAPLGIAVDIGTTTVAAMLLDLAAGSVTGRASMYNQQIRRADDVASRISFCRDDAAVDLMRRLVAIDTVQVLIEELCRDAGVPPDRVTRIALCGNTTMMHLLAGLSPVTMGVVPFTPVMTRFPVRPARELDLRIHPDATADLLPSASAYIGADIVADLLASNLATGPQPALLIDIGTNGEMVLARDGKLFACATAAGPAFEGAGLSHGCRAGQGAIDHIRFDAALDLRIDVIGGGEPLGLCGSAVVDFLACGRRSGLLNEFGRFDRERLQACGRLTEVADEKGRSLACLLAERALGERGPVSISEADIAQALKAKAAIQAGVNTLMEVCDCRAEDLQRVVIAGGFGHFVDLANAIAIGLLPDVPEERIEIIGNGSLAGAALCLLDRSAAPALDRLAGLPEIVELNRVASFEDHFIEALMLP